jgi:hypothetical protein
MAFRRASAARRYGTRRARSRNRTSSWRCEGHRARGVKAARCYRGGESWWPLSSTAILIQPVHVHRTVRRGGFPAPGYLYRTVYSIVHGTDRLASYEITEVHLLTTYMILLPSTTCYCLDANSMQIVPPRAFARAAARPVRSLHRRQPAPRLHPLGCYKCSRPGGTPPLTAH